MEMEEEKFGIPSIIFGDNFANNRNGSFEFSSILRKYYLELKFLTDTTYSCNDGSRPGYVLFFSVFYKLVKKTLIFS